MDTIAGLDDEGQGSSTRTVNDPEKRRKRGRHPTKRWKSTVKQIQSKFTKERNVQSKLVQAQDAT